MKIEESFIVDAPLERVWPAIRDARAIAPCVPGCQEVEELGADRYRARVMVALGPIKADFQLVIEVLSEVPPVELLVVSRGDEGGRASSLTARTRLQLAPSGAAATEVRYESEVTLTGRLGNYGLGLMKKRAQVLGQEFARNLKRQLSEPAG